jgi:hypothetical protein
MARTTRTTTFQHLANTGALGTVLTQLMMFVNDLTLCNDALEQWHKYEDEQHKRRASGAKMYFIRLMISHIREGLALVNYINSRPALRNAVSECDAKTQQLYKRVLHTVGAIEIQRIKQVRDNITFHYLGQKIEPALIALAKKHPENIVSMSIGDHPLDWHFEPSDRLIDNAVLPIIFKLPEDADLEVEQKAAIETIQSIGDDLVKFAGQFIFQHAPVTA